MDAASASHLFDQNAATYDRVNSVISLGLDARWYRWAARTAVARPGARVLDAFAGTGQLGVRAARLGAEVTLADASERMLAQAEQRAERYRVSVTCVATDLTAGGAVLGGPFDTVTVMWGLRYVDDPTATLRRLSASLADDGRVVVVDFVEPGRSWLSRLAGFYFFRILPRIAGALAGRRELYSALVSTTHAMGSSANLLRIVTGAGLEVVEVRRMGFGLVMGVVARRATS